MSDLSYLYVMMKQVFQDVYVVKPESSRAMSAESFVIGLGFKADANLALMSESITVLQDKSSEMMLPVTAAIQHHDAAASSEESK